MEKTIDKNIRKYVIIILLILLFLFNTFKFLKTSGNGHPVIAPLISMISYLRFLF